MFKLVILLIIQFGAVYNEESECGCNVNRAKVRSSDEETMSCRTNPDANDKCSGDHENKYTKPVNTNLFDDEMVLLPSGDYQVGTDDIILESDKEGPKRIVHLKAFYLDKHEVSNREFSRFAKDTKYKTEAEAFGDSFVFLLFLNSTFREQLVDYRVAQAPWWYKVTGANWRHPHGPDSEISDILDHPVIHASWNDARAYCDWRGARLPSEAEWEAACRGGHRDTKYPWGDKLFPDRKHMANIWQGTFPNHNSAKDGYVGTNPVNEFQPNDYQLYNMAGNVWEWTEDSWAENKPKEKVKKGGSFLCHRSYCYRYRCSARSHNTDDSSAGNLGFRCAKSAENV